MSTPSRTYSVIADTQDHTIDVKVSEPPTGPILGLSTWSASLVVANQLHKLAVKNPVEDPVISNSVEPGDETLLNGHITPPARPRILEVGAGTGLAGLSAALLWHTDVVLTDIADCITNISKSIALNATEISAQGITAQSGALNWNEPTELFLRGTDRQTPDSYGKFDTVLAADTVYDEDHPEMLAVVIKAWLSEARTARFILGYPLRIMHLEWIRDLWWRLERMGLKVVKEGKVNIGEEWDDERLLEWVVWTWDEDKRGKGHGEMVNGV